MLLVPGGPGKGNCPWWECTRASWRRLSGAGQGQLGGQRCRLEDNGNVRPVRTQLAGGQGEAGRQTCSRSLLESLGGQGAGTVPALVGGGVPEGSGMGMAPSELGKDHSEHEEWEGAWSRGRLRWGLSPGRAWTRGCGWEERTSSRH